MPDTVFCRLACRTSGILSARRTSAITHKLDRAGLRFLNTEALRDVVLEDRIANLLGQVILDLLVAVGLWGGKSRPEKRRKVATNVSTG